MMRVSLSGMDILRAVDMARIVLQFGQVRRVTMHLDGEYESDTTHTVMLALLALEMAGRAGLDIGLAVQYAVVHDLAEAYAGDKNTAHGLTESEAAAKAEREAEAMERLAADLDGTRTIALLQRYEAQVDPEARLVRYLDKVTPKLTHFLNGGRALLALGITADGVREKHAVQGALLTAKYPDMTDVRCLFEEACAMVERGIDEAVIRL